MLRNKQGCANITDLLMADNAPFREAQQNYIVALIELRKAELGIQTRYRKSINPKMK
ncbi:MAG: hypothetical protein R2758_02185 [Bacteroidales bacterium]